MLHAKIVQTTSIAQIGQWVAFPEQGDAHADTTSGRTKNWQARYVLPVWLYAMCASALANGHVGRQPRSGPPIHTIRPEPLPPPDVYLQCPLMALTHPSARIGNSSPRRSDWPPRAISRPCDAPDMACACGISRDRQTSAQHHVAEALHHALAPHSIVCCPADRLGIWTHVQHCVAAAYADRYK